MFDDCVEQFSCTRAVDGRDTERVSQSACIKLGRAVLRCVIFYFIGNQQCGLFTASQYGRHLIIEIGDTMNGIDDKEYDIGLFDSNCYLLVDFFLENVVGVDYPTAGVDNRKLLSCPVNL